MARYVISLLLVTLVLVCWLQTTSAFDLAEYIKESLQNTIEKEHINCSNYKEFCERSNQEINSNKKPRDAETIGMAVTFCKTILRIYVCDVDLD